MSFTFLQRTIELKTRLTPEHLLTQLYIGVRTVQERVAARVCSNFGIPCGACRQAGDCPAAELFSQVLSPDPEVVRRHQKPPLPFSFSFSRSGRDVECRLCVAGKAVRHVDLLVLAFMEIARESGADIHRMWNVGYHGEQCEAAYDERSENSLILLGSDEVLAFAERPADCLKFELLSPLRFMREGRLIREFDLSLLVRSQLRRLSALAAYYGDGPLDLDYAVLSSHSDRIAPLTERYVNGMAAVGLDRYRFGGITGCGEYDNLFDGLLSVLKLGSYFNAGKMAAWGMGAYRVSN